VFVRAKRQGERVYHYLVASERQGGQVRQKTVAYLGEYPTIQAALEALPNEITKLREESKVCAMRADATRQQMHPAWIERNHGEVPRRRRRGLSTASKLFSRYWSLQEQAQACEQSARLKAAQLSKLQAACSAHDFAPSTKTLGTTRKVTAGVLCVRWERHERGRAKYSLESYRLALLARRPGGIVCSLASLREEYYDDPKSRRYQEIMFWKDAAVKLDTLRLDPSDRAKIEAQLGETIRRPPQDEIRKYDEEYESFMAWLRKSREARCGEASR